MLKKTKVEESSIQYSCRVNAAVCVRALQMCAWETSHTVLDCYFNNPECLLCSPCAFGQSLYRVLIREIEQECTALAVMHRWRLCKNVDSAKIKVPFYTTDIYILRIASMHRIVIHHIDPYQ